MLGSTNGCGYSIQQMHCLRKSWIKEQDTAVERLGWLLCEDVLVSDYAGWQPCISLELLEADAGDGFVG